MAIVIAGVLYVGLRSLRERSGVTKETCICVSDGSLQPVLVTPDGMTTAAMATAAQSGMSLSVDEQSECVQRYQGKFVGLEAQKSLDAMHYLSAGAVCFSRAVNDTPKVAALLLITAIFSPTVSIAVVGVAIALGGILQARQVAETMSKRITPLSPGQGFTANITTAILVLFASNLGVPVSTTHVSCGSIFGISVATRTGRWQTISKILLTWVTTLPFAAAVSACLYLIL